jgi:hypothetical protein
MSKKDDKKLYFASTTATAEMMESQGFEPMAKSDDGLKLLVQKLQGSAVKGRGTIPRIAFTEQPNALNHYSGIYKAKARLLPDAVIKDIRVRDHLIAAILNARGNTLSMFARKRHNRLDIGIEIVIKPELEELFTLEEISKIKERKEKLERMLFSCGNEEGLQEEERMTLGEFMYLQTKNGLAFGRYATEIIRDESDSFSRFRPIDAGTIYRSVRHGEMAAGIRESSIQALKSILGHDVDIEMFKRDEYEWIQVIDQTPRQAFSSKEMLVHNLYPSTDVEHNGYPVTPLDNIMSSVTTHMSIEAYQKLYFMNGRAAKGMVVLQSDEIDQSVIDNIKQEYMASINNVENSFRVPIFGVGQQDRVEWISTSPQKKDGEFQFLYEQVSRNILSAFNMSPDELPGYTHLSRGTNQKTLSESNNEFKLTAMRDTGLRPLILRWEEFLNRKLFPIMDEELSQICMIKISGLDAESRQEESLRLQQDQPIHMNMDEVLDEVEKTTVGDHMGGQILFNEHYNMIVDKYLEVGHYLAETMNDPAHYYNTTLKYKRDAFWANNMGVLMSSNPDAVKAYYAEDPEFSYSMYRIFMEEMLEEEYASIGDSDNE